MGPIDQFILSFFGAEYEFIVADEFVLDVCWLVFF
jgi:hypothetical protein